MSLLSDATAAAAASRKCAASLLERELEWAVRAERERRELARRQCLERFSARFGVPVSAVSLERFEALSVAVIDDLVLVEESQDSQLVEVGEWAVHVSPFTPLVLGVFERNPFRPESASSHSRVVAAFPLRDLSELPPLLLEHPRGVFDAAAVLALLAEGSRVATSRAPYGASFHNQALAAPSPF